jgi:hypothetical protein
VSTGRQPVLGIPRAAGEGFFYQGRHGGEGPQQRVNRQGGTRHGAHEPLQVKGLGIGQGGLRCQLPPAFELLVQVLVVLGLAGPSLQQSGEVLDGMLVGSLQQGFFAEKGTKKCAHAYAG